MTLRATSDSPSTAARHLLAGSVQPHEFANYAYPRVEVAEYLIEVVLGNGSPLWAASDLEPGVEARTVAQEFLDEGLCKREPLAGGSIVMSGVHDPPDLKRAQAIVGDLAEDRRTAAFVLKLRPPPPCHVTCNRGSPGAAGGRSGGMLLLATPGTARMSNR
jgi:hypothetical protein